MTEATYKKMTKGFKDSELMELAEDIDDLGTYAFLELEEKGFCWDKNENRFVVR